MHKSYLYVLFLHIYALYIFNNVMNCKQKKAIIKPGNRMSTSTINNYL